MRVGSGFFQHELAELAQQRAIGNTGAGDLRSSLQVSDIAPHFWAALKPLFMPASADIRTLPTEVS